MTDEHARVASKKHAAKPGYMTTEFFTTTFATLAGIAFAALGDVSENGKLIALAIVAAVAMAYTLTRGSVKKAAAKSAPLLLGVLLLGLTACCPLDDARARALRKAEINRAHADDKSLPTTAREIAQDNADAWEVQAYHLGGPEPSAATLERLGGE